MTDLAVHLPTLLRSSVGGRDSVVVDATTLREGLETLLARYPLLRFHLYDESGAFRTHVIVYYNGESVALMESLDVPLREGDELEVINAVSGG
jgi:molybdopterin converting factor small subunit